MTPFPASGWPPGCSPERAAAEIARLHRTHCVMFVDLADGNLASSKRQSRAHLRWCFRDSFRVLRAEIGEFLWRRSRMAEPMTLAEFQGGVR